MIELLSAYLTLKTDHPNPNYQGVIDLFTHQAELDHLPYQKIPLTSTTEALIISLHGSNPNLPALALNHHCDVVGADDNENWQAPPFSGKIINGMIIGRGAQDMKGVGVMHYAAIAAIKASKLSLRKTVHCIIVPDEERGGYDGTNRLINTAQFKDLRIGYVIDEGMPSGSSALILVKVAERKPLQLKITLNRPGGHASDTSIKNPINEMYQCLEDIRNMQQNKSDFSMHITSFQAGDCINFNQIPTQAEAIIDLRIDPSINISVIYEKIKTLVAYYKPASIKLLASAEEPKIVMCQEQQPEYTRIIAVLEKHGLQAVPFVSNFASDLRYYWNNGIPGMGLSPLTNNSLMHAQNETISLTDLERGRAIFIEIIQALCS